MKTDIEKYNALVNQFTVGMLVTSGTDGLSARPMTIAAKEDDGRLWLVTHIDAGQVEQITAERSVNLCLQSTMRYMSIAGQALIVRDEDRKQALWQPAFDAWFQHGCEDPHAVLICIVPESADYWDLSGTNAVRTIFEIGKSIVTNSLPAFDDAVNDTLFLNDGPATTSGHS